MVNADFANSAFDPLRSVGKGVLNVFRYSHVERYFP